MYELTVLAGFSSAHNLRNYDGVCENLHGHNWRIEVMVCSEVLNDLEMVVDFKVIKTATRKLADSLDHVYLNEIPPFDKINPTAENIARYIHGEVSKAINDENVKVSRVKVWESDTSAATYSK